MYTDDSRYMGSFAARLSELSDPGEEEEYKERK
jgi:hypothetical protein